MFIFEWDKEKERVNIAKHGVSFADAELAFDDPDRVLKPDLKHSLNEKRWLCFGMVRGDIMTVRFTTRGESLRIIGAAYWRKGRKEYEKEENT